MGFTRTLKAAGEKKFEGNNAAFKPLTAGPYVVSIFDAERDEFKSGEGKVNGGRPLVNVQFRVEDGQEGANRRIFQQVGLFAEWGPTAKNPDGSDNFTFFDFFSAVRGDASSKALREEVEAQFEEFVAAAEAAGKTEIDVFDFEPKVLDKDGKEIKPSSLIGRKLVLNLKVKPDTYAYNKAKSSGSLGDQTEADFKRNEIGGFKIYDGSLPAQGAANTASPKVAAVEL